MPNKTLVDGVSCSTISINNRGLSYGDGLFETIKVQRAVPEFYELHLQRLISGCQRLNITFDELALRKEITQLLSESLFQQSVLKIIITRGDTTRGYRYEANLDGHRIISLDELTQDYGEQQRSGVKTIVCQTRLAANSAVAGIKHLNRLENVIARAEWHDSTIAEGLLFDTENHLVEGVMSNVFLVDDGVLYTPSLKSCGVEGIIRHVILYSVASALNLSVHVGDVSREQLTRADEVFLCNSLIGIWPVIAIDEEIREIGSITRKVQNSFLNVSAVDE